MNYEFDIDEYFEVMKKVTSIPIEAEWEPSIKAHLINARKMSNLIEQTPIDNNTSDFSNIFTPGNSDV